MSLDDAQRRRTADELAANLDLSGLDVASLQALSGLSPSRIMAALTVSGADPRDVWLLRDLLETAVQERGVEPVPYSVLTEQARTAAAGWFGVTDQR